MASGGHNKGYEQRGRSDLRGPEPTLYGRKQITKPSPRVTNPDGSSWWVGVSREEFSARVRGRTDWGEFAERQISYAPDAYPPPRKKRETEI